MMKFFQIGVPRSSVQRIIKNDLNLTAFKKVQVHKLNDRQKLQRLLACNKLLDLPTLAVNRIVFTDEKNFPLSAPTNAQNDRVYAAGKKKNVNSKRLLR